MDWKRFSNPLIRNPMFKDAHGRSIEIEEGAPNLDGEDESWLGSFWFIAKTHPVRVARVMFPDDSQRSGHRRGAVKAVYKLAAYAIDAAVARRLRREGKIQQAEEYERSMERRYGELPEYARW